MTAQADPIQEGKELVCELCRNFYSLGWVSGTGGGISVKVGDRLVVAPSGVQKERMRPEDMFVLDSAGNVVHTPEARPAPYNPPKLSECTPLFMAAYELRGAGAVMHSHSMNAVLATMLDEHANEFKVTHLEMIKGIVGHGFYGNCVVPIIENTARECELTDRLRQAIRDYPEANAVLVRRHGVYVWGKTWIEAKTQSECYDYLFEAAVKMRSLLGTDAARAPAVAHVANGNSSDGTERAAKKARSGAGAAGGRLPRAVVLDIEGTVAPITYVKDVLFPYAAARVRTHLEDTYDSRATQADVELLRRLGQSDAAEGRAAAVAIPAGEAGKAAVVDACCASVAAQMAEDRKTTALKSLQGHIWHQGFAKGELKAELYRDVPDALCEWARAGIKTYIYSSGSRQAQRDLFGHTTAGDMRPYLCGFFDTTSGAKVEASSYDEIALALGVDHPGDILFATDLLLEAQAASQAGWRAVVAVRPGNTALPQGHGFREVTTMAQLL